MYLPRYDHISINPKEQWKLSQYYAERRVGVILLIMDNDLKRNEWKKGVITEVMHGNDHEIRVVKVKLGKNTLIRPSNKLIKFA